MKVCKGTGKARGFGCGKQDAHYKFGLCLTVNHCFQNWLHNSEEGQEMIIKASNFGRKKVGQTKKSEASKAKKEGFTQLMSVDAYRAKVVQPIFNEIARLIDWGLPCIATGNFGKMNGGHRISVGANRSVCLNLHNIHRQVFESNHHKSGDPDKYDLGLEKEYGLDYVKYIKSLHQTPLQKWTKQILEEIKIKATEQRNKLKSEIDEGIQLNAAQRIAKREEINQAIGIYKPMNQ